jgi:hypothetical protein
MRNPDRYWWFLLVLALLLGACSKEKDFIGTYQPVPGSPPEYAGVSVELKKGGEGIRRVQGGADQAFQWVVKRGEMRIHTSSGGVIVAKPQGDLFEVRFPGRQVVCFKKVR